MFNLLNIICIYSQTECEDCINRKKVNLNLDCNQICYNQNVILNDCSDYTVCLYDYSLHKVENVCVCQKIECNRDYICPNIDEIHFNEKLTGYTTYEVSLLIKNLNYNIFAIYGDNENNMIIPRAYQTKNNLGTNIGGINPLLINNNPEAQYDSWLTIGSTMDNQQVNYIGIDFSSWDINHDLIISNGAIFLDDPMIQISTKKYIVAHLTLKNNQQHQMIINADGRLNANDINANSFSEKNIIINFPYIVDAT